MASKAKKITVDASGQTLGRLASHVATLLRGKNLVSFSPNKNPGSMVEVLNLSKVRFSGSKLQGKKYFKYSGYPGGMKITTLDQEFKKSPERLFTNMVRLMLPKNRLAKVLMKNLSVELGKE